LRTIGAHIFYRWSGRNGTRAAFINRYGGIENLPHTPAATDAKEDDVLSGVAWQEIEPDVTEPVQVELAERKETGLLATREGRFRSEANDHHVGARPQPNGLIADRDSHKIPSRESMLIVDRK
jgi:hypothetical protein